MFCRKTKDVPLFCLLAAALFCAAVLVSCRSSRPAECEESLRKVVQEPPEITAGRDFRWAEREHKKMSADMETRCPQCNGGGVVSGESVGSYASCPGCNGCGWIGRQQQDDKVGIVTEVPPPPTPPSTPDGYLPMKKDKERRNTDELEPGAEAGGTSRLAGSLRGIADGYATADGPSQGSVQVIDGKVIVQVYLTEESAGIAEKLKEKGAEILLKMSKPRMMLARVLVADLGDVAGTDGVWFVDYNFQNHDAIRKGELRGVDVEKVK